jgi:muramoyltetrapeptide carboxypeptidase
MKPLLIPPVLIPGQKVTAIAPSGAIRERELLEQGLQIWRDRGYEVYVPESIYQTWGYLAGSDQDRRQQLLDAWHDPDCVALICARGGYGCTRLLEQMNWHDFGDLAAKPKLLIGFSDITALLWGMAHHLNIGGLHAPVLTTLSSEPDWSIEKLFNWLEGTGKVMTLAGSGWGGGRATGVLLPANLNVATHLIGTSAFPDLANVILAFEDVAEAPYKVDRLLTKWRMTGCLSQIKGMALGRFSRGTANHPSLSMEEVWRDRLMDLNIPIIVDMTFGHDGTNLPLAVGCEAQIDGDTGLLTYWRT